MSLRKDIDLRSAKLLPKLDGISDAEPATKDPWDVPQRPRVPTRSKRRRRRGKNHGAEDSQLYRPQYFRLKLTPSQPTRFLCSECSLAIERDAEFWGKKWQSGGQQLLKMLDEHAQRYPHFLLAFMQRTANEMRSVMTSNPNITAQLVDKYAIALEYLQNNPEMVADQIPTLPCDVLVEYLGNRSDALERLAKIYPSMFVELMRNNQGLLAKVLPCVTPLALAAFLNDPNNEQTVMESVLNNSDRLQDLIMDVPPDQLAKMISKKVDCASIFGTLLKSKNMFKSLLKQFTPDMVQEMLDDPRHQGMLQQSFLTSAKSLEKLISEVSPEMLTGLLTTLLGDEDSAKVLENFSTNHLMEKIIVKGKNDPQFQKHLQTVMKAAAGSPQIASRSLDAAVAAKAVTPTSHLSPANRAFIDKNMGAVLSYLGGHSSDLTPVHKTLVEDNLQDILKYLTEHHSEHMLNTVTAYLNGTPNTRCLVQLCEKTDDSALAAMDMAASDMMHGDKFWAHVENLFEQDSDRLTTIMGNLGVKARELTEAELAERMQKLPLQNVLQMLKEHPDYADADSDILESICPKCRHRFEGSDEDERDAAGVNKRASVDSQITIADDDEFDDDDEEYENRRGSADSVRSTRSTKGRRRRKKRTRRRRRKKNAWAKQLDGKFSTSDAAFSQRALMLMIWSIYESMITYGQPDTVIDVQEFVIDFIMMQYGTKSVVKKKLRQLMKSLHVHRRENAFISAFYSFCGLPGAEDLRDESQFQSYLWAIQMIFTKQKQLKLDMCDNSERAQIRKAGGVVEIAFVRMDPALTLLKQMLVSFHGDADKYVSTLKESSFELEDDRGKLRSHVAVEEIMRLFLDASDAHAVEDRSRLEDLFKITDMDNSGTVDYEEFKKLIQSLPAFHGANEFELSRMFNSVTPAGESELDVAGFVRLAQGQLKNTIDDELMTAIEDSLTNKTASYNQMMADYVLGIFRRWEGSTEDGSGIPVSAFPELIRTVGFEMSDNEAATVIRIIDKDGDGTIDKSEFLDWWQEYAMEQVFLKHDTDGSGELSRTEVVNLLKQLGITWETEEEFNALFEELDPDGNEEISFAELVQWFSVFDARKVFEKYDTDGSNTLGLEELDHVLTDLGVTVTPQILTQALDALDSDSSGEIDFNEFLPWWISQKRRRRGDRLAASRQGGGENRRRSEQVELSTKDAAYLKMSAQRERNMQESQRHLKNILSAIAQDNGFNEEQFLDKYFVAQDLGSNNVLLKAIKSPMASPTQQTRTVPEGMRLRPSSAKKAAPSSRPSTASRSRPSTASKNR